MTDETKLWLDAHPDSDHPIDTERWYNAIIKAFRAGIDLDFEEIRNYILETREWDNGFVDEFIEKFEIDYSKLKNFYDYILKEKQLSYLSKGIKKTKSWFQSAIFATI